MTFALLSDKEDSLKSSYSEGEMKEIKDFFGQFIQEGKTPPIEECRTFLTVVPSGVCPNKRTAKHIQDKVRTIIKQ